MQNEEMSVKMIWVPHTSDVLREVSTLRVAKRNRGICMYLTSVDENDIVKQMLNIYQICIHVFFIRTAYKNARLSNT